MAITMVTHVTDRWLWRDLRLVYVLLVWAVFGFSLFFFFSGDIFSGGFTLRGKAPDSTQQAQSDDEIYTGSIIIVPPRGNQCWQMMLDNRTGRMWENGYVDCYVAVRELAENKRSGTISTIRIRSIMDAFRGEGQ